MENNTEKKMTRKQRETKLRQQIILEAAEKLFIAKGYEDTTMDEIANVSEFSKGTLYNYFNSKDELYLAIGIKAYKLIVEYTKKFTEKERPGIPQLMAVGYAYYEFSKDYPSYASIFHDIAVKIPDISTKPKENLTIIEQRYIKSSEEYRDVFLEVMKEAVKAKAIRSDKDPNLIGYILSMVTSGLVRDIMQSKHVLARLGLKADDIITFAFEVLAEGLKPRKQKQKNNGGK
ncbi:MAG: TetR/AcrR family transcriptional regulator [Candidatus Thorarchaeota archaeon]